MPTITLNLKNRRYPLAFLFLLMITITVPASASDKAVKLDLVSTSASDGGILPVEFTCDGRDQSPALNWTGLPAKTQSFVLILTDPDAPNPPFYHWVLINIPKNVNRLPQGISTLPSGIIEMKNTWDKKEYRGPCPPAGTSHHYIFSLYALDTNLNLAKDADAKTILKAIQNHVLDKDDFIVTYSRWPAPLNNK